MVLSIRFEGTIFMKESPKNKKSKASPNFSSWFLSGVEGKEESRVSEVVVVL
ncbi:hypothetical protein EV201_1121 [Ancylomarina subtilis]|uniref:Uncharacterized protein n=1 Tax=Ancylomarina subtilis TaxID=1639035 RepID=A0A4Q7VJW2_9BACT|nr:hypothetical protein [Ancylomarina subtilis]RZT96483.1 hypothetical protein EV201_1121 [Ancylomarina subtilis]